MNYYTNRYSKSINLICIQLPDGAVTVGGAKLTSTGTSVYNLGAMFTVQGPVMLRDEVIGAVLAKVSILSSVFSEY